MTSMGWPSSRPRRLRRGSRLERGGRVVYRGDEKDGLVDGMSGTVVSDVPGSMDVRPYATPPTVPEVEEDACVEVDIDGIGRRTVAVRDLRPRRSDHGERSRR